MPETHPAAEPNLTSGVATTRRTVLRTAGLIALAGGAAAMASCGTDNQAAGAPTTTAGGGPTSAPASPAASPSDSPTAAKSSPAPRRTASRAPSGPSVATSSVPVGGGVILSDADYVVTQPNRGTYKAFTSTCTHQACKVAEVSGGVIRCNCHGSQFSIRDGSVTNPPASQPLEEFKVTVSDSRVVVTE
jgi:nitrite reductase/ring-hydroxylating ferredoxin subunit